MKSIYLLTAFAVTAGSASAAIVADFESYAAGDLFTDLPGWNQSEANPIFEGSPVPLAQVVNALGFNGGAGSLAGSIGTLEANNPFAATTTVGTSLGASPVFWHEVSVNLAIVDDADDAWTVRDQFAINLTADGGAELASVIFNPSAGDDTAWDVSFSVGGGTAIDTSFAILAGGEYELSLSFLTGSLQLDLNPAGGGPGASEGTAFAYDPGASFGDIVFSHTQVGFEAGPGDSANAMLFDDVEVNLIPEPSVALLAGLGLLGLARRRRA